ncbi:DUF86 domain-containing protein [Metabacillus herbersteinensis]|uniref:DUF86 domain-containing protein n=1 Tax=Metabacillus herbersteinensis TaxID=283816 RepID=A0ABV6GBX8_9BACI
MYFVDRKKIEATLVYIDEQIRIFESQMSWEADLERKALERISHLIIEGILDVGNAMIDGFIMRDPGSYEDIIDILLDEKVIHQADADGFKNLISLRKSLVQEYLTINHRELEKTYQDHLPSLQAFSGNIREYLNNELGPVSAFKP